MPLNIFESDPAAVPKPRSSYEPPAFKLASGMQDEQGRPLSLETWRFTSDDKEVLDAIAQLYGGQVEEFHTKNKSGLHVVTTAADVSVVVSGPDALEQHMILWGAAGPIHHCDGTHFLAPEEDKGEPCGCPEGLEDRKALAQKGRGPQPYIKLRFRLADDQDLGVGEFTASSWGFAKEAYLLEKDLQQVGGEALVSLRKEYVSFTQRSTGRLVEYTKAVPKVQGAFNDAIAE